MNILTIWMYWENQANCTFPTYLNMCYQAAVNNCPKCNVILLNPYSLKNYLDTIPFDLDKIRLETDSNPSIPLKSDFIRAAILKKYGGVWIDIDCIILSELYDSINLILENYDFYGMKKTKTSKLVTNNFIATKKNGIVISDYYNKICEIISKKITSGQSFFWSEIGASLLTSVVNNHIKICYFEKETNIHPIHFSNSDIFWKKNDNLNLKSILNTDTKMVMLYNARFNKEQKNTPKHVLLNDNTLLGSLMRKSLNRYDQKIQTSHIQDTVYNLKDIEILFITENNPQSCLKLIKSVRKNISHDIHIRFSIPKGQHKIYNKIANKYNCNIYFTENNITLGDNLNLLFKSSKFPLILLCDSDFAFDKKIDFTLIMKIFNSIKEIGILGGIVEKFKYNNKMKLLHGSYLKCFNNVILKDKNVIKFIPAEYIDLPRHYFSPDNFIQEMDTVNSFAIYKRDIFSDFQLTWDQNMRNLNDTENFFIDYKNMINGKFKIFYTNLLLAQQHYKEYDTIKTNVDRKNFLKSMLISNNIKQMIFYGKRSEILQQDNSVHRGMNQFWRKP